MRLRCFVFLGLIFGVNSFLEADEGLPLLVYNLGEEARPEGMKHMKSCKIYPSAIKEQKNKKQLMESIRIAKTSKDITAFHMVAQVPSINIWAYPPDAKSQDSKYLLFRDYDTVVKKSGKEAEFLIKFARDFCKSKLKK